MFKARVRTNIRSRVVSTVVWDSGKDLGFGFWFKYHNNTTDTGH